MPYTTGDPAAKDWTVQKTASTDALPFQRPSNETPATLICHYLLKDEEHHFIEGYSDMTKGRLTIELREEQHVYLWIVEHLLAHSDSMSIDQDAYSILILGDVLPDHRLMEDPQDDSRLLVSIHLYEEPTRVPL